MNANISASIWGDKHCQINAEQTGRMAFGSKVFNFGEMQNMLTKKKKLPLMIEGH